MFSYYLAFVYLYIYIKFCILLQIILGEIRMIKHNSNGALALTGDNGIVKVIVPCI